MMIRPLIAALLLGTVGLGAMPRLAHAQSTPNNSMSQPIPNQTNLQDQANQSSQPSNAQSGGAAVGQASSVPTPTLQQGMTKVPEQAQPPAR